MKIRTSFVTNSSSSSFIIAGVAIDRADFDYDKAEDLDIDYTNTDYDVVIGKSISRFYESYSVHELNLDDITQKIMEAKLNAEKYGLDPNDVKIYFGVEYC